MRESFALPGPVINLEINSLVLGPGWAGTRVKVPRDACLRWCAVSSLRDQQWSGGSVFICDPGKGSYSTVCGTFVSISELLVMEGRYLCGPFPGASCLGLSRGKGSRFTLDIMNGSEKKMNLTYFRGACYVFVLCLYTVWISYEVTFTCTYGRK